jgi:hypothetical protein
MAGATWHERAIERKIDRMIVDDPGSAMTFLRLARDLNHKEGHWHPDLVDIVVQGEGGRYDIHDAYCYAVFLGFLTRRKVAFRTFGTDGPPARDREKEQNDAIFRGLDPESPFFGEFHGGAGDSDGVFGWRKPIEMYLIAPDTPEEYEVIEVPPTILPLEVGTTMGSRTLLHLMEDRGIARWPYGHDILHCFYVVDRTPVSLSDLPGGG